MSIIVILPSWHAWTHKRWMIRRQYSCQFAWEIQPAHALPQYNAIWICLMMWNGTRFQKDEASEELRVSGKEWLTCNYDCCGVVSVGFTLQLRQVIRIPLGFDLEGCSVFQYVLKRKADVGVVLMLFCKPGLRPGFSWIDDITVVPFISYLAMSSHSRPTLWSFRAPFSTILDCS